MSRAYREKSEGAQNAAWTYASQAYGGTRSRRLVSVEVTWDQPVTASVVILKLVDDLRGPAPIVGRIDFVANTSGMFLPSSEVILLPKDGIQVNCGASGLAGVAPRSVVTFMELDLDPFALEAAPWESAAVG